MGERLWFGVREASCGGLVATAQDNTIVTARRDEDHPQSRGFAYPKERSPMIGV